jgi:hypothetical protein
MTAHAIPARTRPPSRGFWELVKMGEGAPSGSR